MNRTQLEAAAALGCRIQIWHLVPGDKSSADGQWDTCEGRPKFECPIHLYRVHPDDLHLLRAGYDQRAVAMLAQQYRAKGIDGDMGNITNGPWSMEEDAALRAIVAALQEAPADFIDPNSRNFKEGFSVGQIVGRDQVRSQHPPCLRCGAETASQAETMCCMAGDEDNCHGCELWTEDERINSTAPVATTRHDAGFEPGPLFTPDEWDRLRALPKGTHLYTRPDPPVANDVLYADAAETRVQEDHGMSDETERLLSELRNKGRAVWTHPNRQDLANRIGAAITALEAENARLREHAAPQPSEPVVDGGPGPVLVPGFAWASVESFVTIAEAFRQSAAPYIDSINEAGCAGEDELSEVFDGALNHVKRAIASAVSHPAPAVVDDAEHDNTDWLGKFSNKLTKLTRFYPSKPEPGWPGWVMTPDRNGEWVRWDDMTQAILDIADSRAAFAAALSTHPENKGQEK